jgi:AraC-like DNA-binding protein
MPSRFQAVRIPPLRELSPIVAGASAGIHSSGNVSWEELGLRLAARVARQAAPCASLLLARDVSRVSAIVRRIEEKPDGDVSLQSLAAEVNLSPYHFLRTFERLTGLTPHQYVIRTRLREAARRLATEQGRIIDIALDSGFGDLSNFNRAFRAEFGVTPRAYRRQAA